MQLQILDDHGQIVGLEELTPAEFKTGSRGYRANGKVSISGARHQLSLNLVEIGSKPKTGKPGK